MAKKILSIILTFVMLFGVATYSLTVDAASKNTVKTSISKVESKAKGFKVTWKKKSKIKGYQVQYSTSSKFKKSSTKTKTVSGAKTKSATINKLKGCNVKYYVRVRTYKLSNGKKVYSSWSKIKKITTLKHKYSKATCIKAKTCKYCKKTSGKKLGHKYSKATCTKAKTCSRCKKTSGKKIGHKYSNSCDKTCNVCKVTRTIKHTYKAASCTKPKTCSVCKETSGKALGHKYKNYVCTMCGQVDKSHAYEYLVEWVISNGTMEGNNIKYTIQAYSGTEYFLTYSIEYDILCVEYYSLILDEVAFSTIHLNTYFYGYSFWGNQVKGYLDAENYTSDLPLIYTNYEGSLTDKEHSLELAKSSIDVLLESLKYCLLINDIPISIADLGFSSY